MHDYGSPVLSSAYVAAPRALLQSLILERHSGHALLAVVTHADPDDVSSRRLGRRRDEAEAMSSLSQTRLTPQATIEYTTSSAIALVNPGWIRDAYCCWLLLQDR
jgi:hypothetical protein